MKKIQTYSQDLDLKNEQVLLVFSVEPLPFAAVYQRGLYNRIGLLQIKDGNLRRI